MDQNTHKLTLCLVQFTFEGRGYRLGGAEGVCVREWTLPSITNGLYSETVAAGLSQSLHLVGVAGTAVDRHKPGESEETGSETMSHKSREKSKNENEGWWRKGGREVGRDCVTKPRQRERRG